MLDLKASRLAQVNAVPCRWRVPLPVDLTGEWSATLQGGGFDRQRPSAWLVEGLTPYLTVAQVHHLLGTLSELAVAGSWLLADVIDHSFLTSPRLAGLRAMMAANGSPFRFGTDDPEGLMKVHGWRPQVSRFDEAGADFGRWTPPATYREDPHSPHGYLIVAHR